MQDTHQTDGQSRRTAKTSADDESELLLLTNWLPTLGVRGLAPGDMLGLLGGTGNLKTASLLNILADNADLPTVVFSLELSEAQMFERIAAISTGMDTEEVERTYSAGGTVEWQKSGRFRNMLVYTKPTTMTAIDKEVSRSSAKLGCAPKGNSDRSPSIARSAWHPL